ncbi:hypothetical protein ACIBG6_31080 [Streptomyces sp. NPDC050842]
MTTTLAPAFPARLSPTPKATALPPYRHPVVVARMILLRPNPRR